MKYENKKTGKLATLIGTNEKFKTVELSFEDGTTASVTTSTLKRWWKAIPEETTSEDEVAVVMKQKKELGIEVPKIDPDKVEIVSIVSDDVAGDGTPLAEVGKEIAKQAKEKAKTAANKKKSTKTKTKKDAPVKTKVEKIKNSADNAQLLKTLNEIKEIIFKFAKSHKDEILITDSKHTCNALKLDGHRYLRFLYNSNSVRVSVVTDVSNELNVKPNAVVNNRHSQFKSDYVFNKATLKDDDYDLLKSILDKSRAYLINKLETKNKTAKKGEKKNGKVQSR